MSEGLLAAAPTPCPPSHPTSFIFLLPSAFLDHILPPHSHHQKQVSKMKFTQTPMQVCWFQGGRSQRGWWVWKNRIMRHFMKTEDYALCFPLRITSGTTNRTGIEGRRENET